jgi:protein-S-isoprenylcysteine O-methyltransferase Ste14
VTATQPLLEHTFNAYETYMARTSRLIPGIY